jgi:DNA-binding beta-propeller fold protein YncE
VQLYLSTDSAAAGDEVAARVSTSVDGPVTAEVFRIGHYGGAGARRAWSGGPFQVSKQPACPMDPSTGRVECQWVDAFSFTVGADWVSGLYAVKVTRADGFRSFAPFVVRDDRAAELLYVAALNTSQAYNPYGGESLYQDDSGTMPAHKAREVSFDRPFAAADGLGKVWRWEAFLVTFLEQYGYDVTYSTNLDFARFGRLTDGVGAVVTGSQDEYWVREERDQLDRMLASGGGSLAFFGADGGYWRVRALPNRAGAPFRTIACYKGEGALDPVPYSTIRFRDSPDPLPESLLFGAMYESWQLVPFPLVVKDPSHWLLEGTGARAGDRFTGLLGYEYDRTFGGALQPPGVSAPLQSPVVSAEGIPSFSEAVERTVPSGRLVFSAGSIYWPEGLGNDPELRDGRVQRMTLNVLERALAHRRAPHPLPDLSGAVPPAPALDPFWAIRVEAFAGMAGLAGAQDGPGASATFNGPTGLAVTAQSQVVVADTSGNRIRLVQPDPDRTVSTLAGDGQLGLRDGPGASARFRRPTGVAVAPDGAIYVADSDNHCIRKLVRDAAGGWTVSTWAGGARVSGASDGPGTAARFNRPTALVVDGAGNLFVADQANHRIRRIDAATAMVGTVAGSSIGALDATEGVKARFNNPSAIAVTPAGDLYVMDAGNQRVRKIAAGGLHAVTTVAGDPAYAFGEEDGTGLVARFRAQMGLALGPSGELLLADMGNSRLRKLILGADAATTTVHTIAGSGLSGTALGDGADSDLPALAGVAVLPSGQLIVSDSFHHVLRVVTR